MTNSQWSAALTLSWLAPPAHDDGGRSRSRRRADIDAHLAGEPSVGQASSAERSRAPTLIDGVPSEVIVARIREGDGEAFAALYLAFRDRLWRFAATLGESPDVAQELVQDLFLALWTRRASLTVREDIAVYLLSAVRHRVYKVSRHARVVARFRERAARHSATNTIGAAADVGAAADGTTLDAPMIHRAIAAALETIPAQERAALMLRWAEERTYDEIGVVLGVSAMGAHKMVTRAMARVRPLLERFRETLEP